MPVSGLFSLSLQVTALATPTPMSTTPDIPPPAKEDTTVALLAYITPIAFLVGIVIAIIMHSNKKTALGAFHLRQVLGLIITSLVAWIPCIIISMIPMVNLIMLLLGPALSISFLVLYIIGLMAAINGQQKPLPLVGVHYQKWLASAFT